MDVVDASMSCSSSKDYELEPMELLDDYWFFQNLLRKQNGMLRSASDPYPSSCTMDEVFAQITNKESSEITNQNLRRAPSLPVRIDRENVIREEEVVVGSEMRKHRQENGMLHENLTKAPSLPASIEGGSGRAEKEAIRRSNKFPRQSSLSSSKALPPLRTPKNTSPGIPKHLVRREPGTESTITDSKPRTHRNKEMYSRIIASPTELESQESRSLQGWGMIKDSIRKPYRSKEMMQRNLSQNKISKSPTQLEIEEVQGFKDLGFNFDKLDINPCVADIIPGLQIKKPDDWNEGKVRRPYLAEAWVVQRPTPLIPDWIDPASSGDMKKQLKYWARAVASNMRQEC